MIYTIIYYVLLVVLVTTFVILKKKNANLNVDLIGKILSFVLLGILFLKSSALDSFIYSMKEGNLYGVDATQPDYLEAIFRHLILWSEC